MTDALVHIGLSNLLFSAVVGVVAYAVHRRGRYPALAHLLWVVVLITAITPPLLTLPLVPSTGAGASLLGGAAATVSAVETASSTASGAALVPAWLIGYGAEILALVWVAGSATVLLISSLRIRRFDALLGRASQEAPRPIQDRASAIAQELGLRSAPTVCLSRARFSPMTWWAGRRVRIFLPQALFSQSDEAHLRWVLAHELAHVKRRDHLVRWLEWLACVAFWWNPVVWWTRRNLRLDEEDACDALVLERLGGQPRAYARTLLATVEILAQRRAHAPAFATGLDAAASLERRLVRIVSPVRRAQAPRWLVVGMVSGALLLMTLGVGSASGHEREDAGTGRAPASTAVPAAEPDPPSETFVTVSADTRISLQPRTPGRVLVGSAGDDTLIGSAGNDIISGRAGADELWGRGGHDVIRGGAGADIIRGEAGRDRLIGGRGADTISGGGKRDIIVGGAGRDTIRAGRGNDVVRTWQDGQPDRIDCGPGDGDRAVIDSSDSTRRCEVVIFRDPS